MADLSANANIRVLGEEYTEEFTVDTSSAREIYRGQPLIVDQSVDATGQVVPFTDSLTVAATDVFKGIAMERKTFASGDTEAKCTVKAWVFPTIVGFKSAVFTAGADDGKTVYMSDSGTLSTTAAANPQIGKVHGVWDGYAWIRLETPQICSGA